MIACTNTQNFEKGENCSSTIWMEHTLGYDMSFIRYDMILFGSDMILIGLIFQVHEPSLLLVAVLVNFSVKKQILQVSFKIVGGDLISFHTFGYDMYLSGYDMKFFGSDMLFGSSFKF